MKNLVLNPTAATDNNNNGSHKTISTLNTTKVSTMNTSMVRRWWSSFLLLGIVFSMVFSACRDHDSDIELNELMPPAIQPMSTSISTNTINYDKIGFKHNEILKESELHKHLFSFSVSTFDKDCHNLLLMSCKRLGYYDPSIFQMLHQSNESILADYVRNDTFSIEYMLSYLADTLVNYASTEDYNLTLEVFNTVKNGISYNDIISCLQDLEDSIISLNLPDSVLYSRMALSVAKYSTRYWSKHYPDAFSPKAKNTFLMSKKEAYAIVLADAAGAIYGGIHGAKVGAFTGPAGSVAAVIGGGIICAAKNSLRVASLWTVAEAFGIVGKDVVG